VAARLVLANKLRNKEEAMFITQFRRLFFVGLAAVLALASISAARAAAPVHSTEIIDVSGSSHCDGFDVIENAAVTADYISFFDNAGNLVRVHGHDTYNGTLTNTATGTIVSAHRGPQNWSFNLDGTAVGRGVFFLLNIPGRGNIRHDVGRVTFYPDGTHSFQGRHEFFPGDEAQMCAALAGV